MRWGDPVKEKLKGSTLLLLATIIWGSAFVAQSAGMDQIGPFTFQTVRCFLAAVVLIPCILISDIKNKRNFFRGWADRNLWKTGIPCGIALFAAVELQQYALLYTTAGKGGFITAMYIVIVPLLGSFVGKKPPAVALIGTVLSVIGLYLLSCVGVDSINIGDIMLIGCAIAFAVQIIIVDRGCADIDSLRLNCVQVFIVTALSFPLMMTVEKPLIQPILSCWLPLCYAGMLSMGAAYTLQIIGQKKLEPTTASLIMSMESVFAVIFGVLILHERLKPWELAGCILMFTAVILSQLPISFHKKPKA